VEFPKRRLKLITTYKVLTNGTSDDTNDRKKQLPNMLRKAALLIILVAVGIEGLFVFIT
jgi:hypothetical protein